MKLTYNINNAKEINQSQDRVFLEGIVRNANRYPVYDFNELLNRHQF